MNNRQSGFHGRRHFLRQFAGAALASTALPHLALGTSADSTLTIAAAWRGPLSSDPYFAGLLEADWVQKRLRIVSATRLPTRPHGLFVEPNGDLLVTGVRPGTWLMRVDRAGQVRQQIDVTANEGGSRLNGHVVHSADGSWVLTTETDFRHGRGQVGVRERDSLKKVGVWETHGIEPHQLLTGKNGDVYVANGGIRRTLDDKKQNLDQMDASLVRLDGQRGDLVQRWQLPDKRLSLRHLAWSPVPKRNKDYLGIALQAEHDSAAERKNAPILAVLDGDELVLPEMASPSGGYAGDIAPAFGGGFALSSNTQGLARVWHPGRQNQLSPIVELPEAYALSAWPGSPLTGGTAGVLIATAPGLVRWHPVEAPQFLPWPEPMALDNHWVLA